MFATLIRLLTGVQARWVDGAEPVEPDGRVPQRVYFANHASNLDAPVIWASLPRPLRRVTRPIAAADYWSSGLRHVFAVRVLNAVLIERKKVTKSNHPLVPMEAALDAGDSLIIFPEGTRLADDDSPPAEFKPGLFHLARKYPAVQFVPVYLENLNRILPKGEFLIVPLLAAAHFGPPLDTVDGEDKHAFLDRARAALLKLADAGEAN